MKATLRQVEAECRVLNTGALLVTPWGILADRQGVGIVLWRVARKPGEVRVEMFRGGPREAMVFLEGVRAGVELVPVPWW